MVKHGLTGPNVALWDQTWPKGPNGPKQDQMGSNVAGFLHSPIFLWDKKIMFSNQGPQTKIGRAMAILLFSWIL